MDFFKVAEKSASRSGTKIIIYPDFLAVRSKDLLVKGKSFYGIWDEEREIWSTDEFDVVRIIDRELGKYLDKVSEERPYVDFQVQWMKSFSSNSWVSFKNYISTLPDSKVQLDSKIMFKDSKFKKGDHISKTLPYSLQEGDISAYDQIIGTLYEPEERRKIEWAIGAIASGDARRIQKFIVLYGKAGTGKSTILNIIQKLFDGYIASFDAEALGRLSNQFATEAFKSNPLVAIQHDGDLSRIENNTTINSIVAHEAILINEKHKSAYPLKLNCMLFMGTNKPVKITDAKSGIIRRLIDVHPSEQRIPQSKYQTLMNRIDFELGAIVYHCLQVYEEMGAYYYDAYKPFEMIEKTDVFFNFMMDNYDAFVEEEYMPMNRAWNMYKEYCDYANLEYKLPMYKFKAALMDYYDKFSSRKMRDGIMMYSVYSGFKKEKFIQQELGKNQESEESLIMDCTESILDNILKDCPAQYAKEDGSPEKGWDYVKTKLSDLDTSKLHYVRPPDNHIFIDFDLKDENGEKNYEKNLKAASEWPPTYSELSKGGEGIHLHYIYDGDVSQLKNLYSEDVEIKVFTGKSSMRRRLTKCNNLPIAHISHGLPLKGDKKVINEKCVKSEKKLRELIQKNLRKEIHPGTKPSVEFIKTILDQAYESDLYYDVSDMYNDILIFAGNSTNHSEYCVKLVGEMKFTSPLSLEQFNEEMKDGVYVFFDIEVFPNIIALGWKYYDLDNPNVNVILNPSADYLEQFFRMMIIGFNCKRYDNHVLYAKYIGKSISECYQISDLIVNHNGQGGLFGNAYDLSYTDIYDFASAKNKKSLKKLEIEMGIHHQELGLPWDKPISEEDIPKMIGYLKNDVLATEASFVYLSADFVARKILAGLAGMNLNTSTNTLTAKILFGDCKDPQKYFNYRDLSKPVDVLEVEMFNFLEEFFPDILSFTPDQVCEENGMPYPTSALPYFPGYKFENGKSTYRGFDVGEGGFVFSREGIYYDVPCWDITSMHLHSILTEVLFGAEFTRRLYEIVRARVEIKHENWDAVREMMDGALSEYVDQIESGEIRAKDLSNGLKTPLVSIYGLTSAKFDNPFHDKRNIDNIVAKRGALFMLDLKYFMEKMGKMVIHIKTDSIKIPGMTDDDVRKLKDFGVHYGYSFECEEFYERICLVNKSVYIAKTKDGNWTATGAQFAHPYIFKTLFSGEEVTFDDLCETKSVKSEMYLDMNESLPEGEHNYQFVGKVGSFCPIKPGCGGGQLVREKDGKYYAVTGTKDYRWMESEVVKELGKEADIDMEYFEALKQDAIDTINKYGNFEKFVNGEIEDFPVPFDEEEEFPFE